MNIEIVQSVPDRICQDVIVLIIQEISDKRLTIRTLVTQLTQHRKQFQSMHIPYRIRNYPFVLRKFITIYLNSFPT
jgi:hypothetical protein